MLYLGCRVLREDEGVDVGQGDHVQHGTPTRRQRPHYQRTKVEAKEREGVLGGRGEPFDWDGELNVETKRNAFI